MLTKLLMSLSLMIASGAMLCQSASAGNKAVPVQQATPADGTVTIVEAKKFGGFLAKADARNIIGDKALDPDGDGMVALADARKAGSLVFVKLDIDKDGKLDMNELAPRLDKAGFQAADADGDGALDQKSYVVLVEDRFHAVNPTGKGSLDVTEFETPKGKALLSLVR